MSLRQELQERTKLAEATKLDMEIREAEVLFKQWSKDLEKKIIQAADEGRWEFTLTEWRNYGAGKRALAMFRGWAKDKGLNIATHFCGNEDYVNIIFSWRETTDPFIRGSRNPGLKDP